MNTADLIALANDPARLARLERSFTLVDPHACMKRWAEHDPRIKPEIVAKRSWKDRITTLLTDEELQAAEVSIEDVKEAIVFYTATEATISRESVAGNYGRTFEAPKPGYLVQAAGYRAGPAGDY